MTDRPDDRASSDLPKLKHLSPEVQASLRRYWRANVKIMAALLTVWAVVGLGCGILFADSLSTIRLGGYPLGFWFAQQGAIVVFVLLILVYAVLVNRLDAAHRSEIESLEGESSSEAIDEGTA